MDSEIDLKRRGVMLAGLGAGAAIAAVAVARGAEAAECPAGKATPNGTVSGPSAPVGVTDALLAAVDLGPEKVRLRGYQLRFRRLVVQPGGVVPVHSHENRPAIIYIAAGEVTEYKNVCSVPITHKAGEATPETHVVVHWWKNNGRVPAVILAADVFQSGEDAHMM